MRKILNWISMTDSNIYSIVPYDVQLKRDLYSISIIISSFWVFILTAYCIVISFSNILAMILIPIIVALTTFTYDRSIINSQSKKSAIPRVFIAILMASFLAIPGEVLFMQGRIDQELDRKYNRENSTIIDESKDRIDSVRDRINEVDNRYEEYKKILLDKIDQFESNYIYHTQLVAAEEKGMNLPDASGIEGRGRHYSFHFKESVKYDSLIKSSRKLLIVAKHEIDNERIFFNSQLTEIKDEERQKNKNQIIGKDYSFLSRFETLEELKKENRGVMILSWLLRIFIWSVDMLPIIKFLFDTNEDEYSALKTSRSAINIQSINLLSNYSLNEIEKDPLKTDGLISLIRQKVHV